jgi:hypothetical protein
MGCEDPGGRIVRLYVENEEHEWTNHPDQDEFWLGETKGDPDLDSHANVKEEKETGSN